MNLEALREDEPIVVAIFESMVGDEAGGLRLRDGAHERLVSIFLESVERCCAARTLEAFIALAGFLSQEEGSEAVIEGMKAVIDELAPLLERKAKATRDARPDPAVEAMHRFRKMLGDGRRSILPSSRNQASGLSLLAVRASR